MTLRGIVRLKLAPHTPCVILCKCSLEYLLCGVIRKHAVMQSHTRLELLAKLCTMVTYKTANDSVIHLLSNGITVAECQDMGWIV